MPKNQKVDRKAKIIAAAIQCFVRKGVAQTKMSDVAHRAGVDQPLIQYYFPEIESLYVEVVQHALVSLRESSVGVIGDEKDPAKILEKYIRGNFSWAVTEKGLFSIWIYFYYMATFSPRFIKLNTTIREAGRDRISLFIYKRIEKGIFQIPQNTTVQELAINIQGLITGSAIMSATEGSKDPQIFAEAAIQASFHLLGYSFIRSTV